MFISAETPRSSDVKVVVMVMMPDADDVDYLAGTKMRGDARWESIAIHRGDSDRQMSNRIDNSNRMR